MKKIAVLFGLYVAVSGYALANGDVEAGQEKAQVCAACHGPQGNTAVDMYPKLAGQHASYIAKQLHDYKLAAETNGEEGRANAIMQGQAMGLSDEDIADLSAYFAAQEPEIGTAPEDVVARAEQLYRGGDLERGIASCAACHGPRGDGMGLAKFPDISGNHATYVKQQLEMFRSGERANDPNGMMRDIASKLTDEDIDLLSKYLGGLY
ncbi:Cytochrome c553 [Pseudidiomarina planktonica]|uniref:Cytochrome c553 n=1 Tax=Pseudidiomarina planktonica TaxID=1323738 RepID=A0A1Y6EBV6_9GAMM|nr:c-type cytochrome [Pseudidiomarina planktonica]RUO66385.1 cytochrome c4 [Pseudidiomarina planktonica]SMQ58380.1 Cytochrome c553 [Pseudidiomarina planktonica]